MLRPGTHLIRHTNTHRGKLGVGSMVQFILYDSDSSQYIKVKTIRCTDGVTTYPEEIGKIKTVLLSDFTVLPSRMSKTKELV